MSDVIKRFNTYNKTLAGEQSVLHNIDLLNKASNSNNIRSDNFSLLSPENKSLYFPKGIIYTQYLEAKEECWNPNNSFGQRVVCCFLMDLTAPLALAEEYLGRSTLNAPHGMLNAGIGIGEHIAEGEILFQRGDIMGSVLEGLYVISNASQGFNSGLTLGMPLAGAIENRMATKVSSNKNLFATTTEVELEEAIDKAQSKNIARISIDVSESGMPIEKLVPVSRWGRIGLQSGDWIMPGYPNYSNFLRSFKWDPNSTNLRVAFKDISTGQVYLVPSESIRWPSGWGIDGWWKGLFGQRIYLPPGQ